VRRALSVSVEIGLQRLPFNCSERHKSGQSAGFSQSDALRARKLAFVCSPRTSSTFSHGLGQQRKFADLARHGPLSQSSLLKASVLGWPDERPQTKGNQAKES
jgi:hypothetical protein